MFWCSCGSAQICIRCPSDANDISLGPAFGVFIHRNGVDENVSGQYVGACETLILKAVVAYNAFGISGGIGAGFTGGAARMVLPDETLVDITPDDMATTLVGPAPCGTTPIKFMKRVLYNFTDADILSGGAKFTFLFTNWSSLLPNAQNECTLGYASSLQQAVLVSAPPSVSLNSSNVPATAGSSASFTAAATGNGPFFYRWSGPNGFSATNASIVISNAQSIDAGDYRVDVEDYYGCSSIAYTKLSLIPRFTTIHLADSNLVCKGSGGASNGTYVVWSTTNSDLGLSVWVALATNQFDTSGQFCFTNSLKTEESARYFRLQIP